MTPTPSFSPTDPLQMAIVLGSTRTGRAGDTIGAWVEAAVATDERFTSTLVDFRTIDLPRHLDFAPDDAVTAWRATVRDADAFVFVLPEYNHSYPAAVKHGIDFVRDEWRRKAAAIVSYGGVSGGLRSAEHLRGVLAELHVATVRETVSFHGPWNGFTDEGQPSDPARAAAAMEHLLDDLAWWAGALRSARVADLEGEVDAP